MQTIERRRAFHPISNPPFPNSQNPPFSSQFQRPELFHLHPPTPSPDIGLREEETDDWKPVLYRVERNVEVTLLVLTPVGTLVRAINSYFTNKIHESI